MTQHEIQISEPWDFTHPNGSNIFKAIAIGVIPGPEEPNYSDKFFLLNVVEPFIFDNELVKQVICSSRYEGDTMDMVTSKECIVGIARVKPTSELNLNSVVKTNEVTYCAIGSIKHI